MSFTGGQNKRILSGYDIETIFYIGEPHTIQLYKSGISWCGVANILLYS